MDYLINVAAASRDYWVLAVAIYAIYFMIRNVKLPASWTNDEVDNNDVDVRKFMPKLALVIFVLGTLAGLMSPANTYKLTTDYNKNQDLRRIEQLDESAAIAPLVIQDIGRQPTSVEERAATAVDIRKRVVLD